MTALHDVGGTLPDAPGASSEPVSVRRVGRTVVATINRPAARNAVDRTVSTALGRALADADADPEVRCFVLTGAGDQAFCAGADLKALSRGEDLLAEAPDERRWGFGGYVAHDVDVPTIAAVNGIALGGGAELALASDLVVAADTARFAFPEVQRGIIAAAGGAFRLPRQVPPKLAMELLLTGGSIDAHRAHELGLVNHVVAPTGLLDAALALAERIAENAPLAVRATKRLARGRGDTDHDDWGRTASEMTTLRASRDAREGARAFVEKRPPEWTGR